MSSRQLGMVVCAWAALCTSEAAAQFEDEQPQLFLHGAIRCGECHEKMVKEWKSSAHAHAASDALYRTLATQAGAAECERCHAPLLSTAGKAYPAAAEGVTCQVCHSLKVVVPSISGAKLEPQLQDSTMYGPLCNAKPHYFHKMGCSPLHEQSAFCGGCHLYYAKSNAQPQGPNLPVYTEFEDWQNSPANKQGADCQSCHMPGTAGEVAKGSPRRKGVAHHGLWDVNQQMRKMGVSATIAQVTGDAQSVTVYMHLKNDGAGHYVPAGDPLHKLVLSVESFDEARKPVERVEHRFGRTLADQSGVEVPFYLAAKLKEDTRLAPGETREDVLKLRAPLNGSLRVVLSFLPASEEVTKAAGAAAAPAFIIAESQLLLKASRDGRRRKLPTNVKVN